MPLSSKQLVGFLREVGSSLDRRITLVAAGGTALTLYRLKASTIDVDFTGPNKDLDLFRRTVQTLQPGFRVDTWPDGQVFSQFLPSDYLRKARRLRAIKGIDLRALAPVDIVVTKLGRLDQRDMEDIKACVKGFGIRERTIVRRAKQVQYVGNQDVYDHNLRTVTWELFGGTRRKRR